MKTLLKLIIILGLIIWLGPVIFIGIVLFLTYAGAIVQSIFGTNEKGSFIILGVLIFLGIFSLFFKSVKK